MRSLLSLNLLSTVRMRVNLSYLLVTNEWSDLVIFSKTGLAKRRYSSSRVSSSPRTGYSGASLSSWS